MKKRNTPPFLKVHFLKTYATKDKTKEIILLCKGIISQNHRFCNDFAEIYEKTMGDARAASPTYSIVGVEAP